MRILFLANRTPYPPFRGDKLKIYALASRLGSRHELHLIAFSESEEDRNYIPELKKRIRTVTLIPLPRWKSYCHTLKGFFFSRKPLQVCYFTSAEMQVTVNRLLARYSFYAVHIQHMRMAQYWEKEAHIPAILDLPDAFSLYWKRRADAAQGWKRWFNSTEQQRIAAYERTYSRFPKVLACSPEDCRWLEENAALSNVALLPNGVDTDHFQDKSGHHYENNTHILFTGNMDYAPNVDAVLFFVREIFPLILDKVPAAKFIIAGQKPVAAVKALAAGNIEVTGFVPDLTGVYRQAGIVVAPLRFGAGTQNKVLEAMAMGVPVVSMEVGFKGLGIHNGEGVFLETEKNGFASRCITLLQDEALRRATGQKGLAIIRNRFSWDTIARQLEDYFAEITVKK